MKKLYTAKLNNVKVFMVREENNTIGMMFNNIEDAKDYLNGGKEITFGIAVNNEVITYGRSVGWLKNIIEIK